MDVSIIFTFYIFTATPTYTTVNVSQTSKQVEGTSINLTCTATSNTHPHNMSTGLDMYYYWTVDNTDIVTDTDYTVGGTNSDTLTINNIQRDDRYKQFVCRSQEGGLSTEGVSSSLTIDVQCKYLAILNRGSCTRVYVIFIARVRYYQLPLPRIEPGSSRLDVQCSTDWAKGYILHREP